MNILKSKHGVTLIELLVSMVVLTLILGGIYTLLNSAFKTYLNVRRRSESQQTAKVVTDYLVQRLREIDGGRTVDNPWLCTGCHNPNMAYLAAIFENATANIPCPRDVTIPNKSIAFNISTIPLPKLAHIPTEYQNMSGNYIRFQADLLPLNGFPESFTDTRSKTPPYKKNGVWDWIAGNPKYDVNLNNKYDPGEPELLEDNNENDKHDHYSEIWTLQLRPSADGGPYYELIESVDFSSLRPQEVSPTTNKLKYNRSVYSDSGYSNEVVAYGLIGLSIKTVPRTYSTARQRVTSTCATMPNYSTQYNVNGVPQAVPNGCHGNNGPTIGAKNIYGNNTSFSFTQFLSTHPWWETQALSIEVTASSTVTLQEHFVKYKQFIIPRNLEINR